MIYLDELEATSALAQEHYSDDVRCANAAVAEEVSDTDHHQQVHEPCPDLPDDLAPIDDAFLDRIQGLASLI